MNQAASRTPAPALLAVGESMAALRAARPLRLGGTLELSIAGSESNVAIGVARLGHRARWAGVVGDDEFGALIERTLRAEGVDTQAARSEPGVPTGLIVFEPRLGEVTRVTYRRRDAAGSGLNTEDVERAFAEPPTLLHVSGITPALSASCREAIRHAVDLAHRHGTRVCLDVNYRAKLWSRDEAAATLTPLADGVHVLLASEDELDLVAEARPGPEGESGQVTALLDRGVDQVVITRGAAGATAYDRATRAPHDAPAAKVRRVRPGR